MTTISSQEFLGGGTAQYVGNEQQIQEQESKSSPSFFKSLLSGAKETLGDIKETGSAIKESATKRSEQFGQSGIIGKIGAAAGLAEDVIGAGVTGAAKSVLPQSAEEAIAKTAQSAISKITQTKVAQDTINYVQKLRTENPKVAEALDALTNVGLLTLDVGTFGLGGSLVKQGIKGGAEMIAEKVPSVIGDVKNLSKIVTENANKYPKELVNKLTDVITPIDKQTENVLKTASIEKFDSLVKTGEEAVSNPRALTPLEKVGEKINNQVLPTIKEDLNRIGAQKAKTLESIKSKVVPNAGQDVIDFIRSKTRGLKLTSEERKAVNELVNHVETLGKNPTIGSADKSVDFLQNTLFEKTKGLAIPTTSRVKGLINSSIKMLNDSVKSVAEKTLGSNEFTVLNDAYSQKIKIFNKLNKALGEDAKKGGSLIKKFFSPQDSGTKKLFADIKSQYGIDLGEDATLARFIMNALGDTRAKTLLEKIPTSPTGALKKGAQYIEQKLTKPIEKARRIIKTRP